MRQSFHYGNKEIYFQYEVNYMQGTIVRSQSFYWENDHSGSRTFCRICTKHGLTFGKRQNVCAKPASCAALDTAAAAAAAPIHPLAVHPPSDAAACAYS
jgi:hypothetical protein